MSARARLMVTVLASALALPPSASRLAAETPPGPATTGGKAPGPTPVAEADSQAVAVPVPADTLGALARPGAGTPPPATTGASSPVGSSASPPADSTAAAAWPWPELRPPPLPGQPLLRARSGRRENDRAGARTALELLDLLPGYHAPHVAEAIEIGALARGGSFGVPRLAIDGWSVRLPRLEGRGLDVPLLDRLGPHAGYATYATVGSLAVATEPPIASPGLPRVRLEAAEPLPGSGSRSRVALYRGGFGVTGGGVTLADRRPAFDYRLGLVNAKGGRGGAIDDLTTRLAMIDAGWSIGGRRFELSARGSERDLIWKSREVWNQDDQGLAIALHGRPGSSVEWSLRTRVTDDRLSGTRWPDLESRRKSWRVGSTVTHHGARLSWGRLWAERDWLALRSSVGVLAPRVERAGLEGGLATAWLGGMLHSSIALRLGDRHPRRLGGALGWRRQLGRHSLCVVHAERGHRAPTLDQEVLARGGAVAEPERLDVVGARLEHAGRWTAALAVARRHLDHVPEIVAEDATQPWPLYDFRGGTSAHWGLEAGLLSPAAPLWKLRVGIHGNLLVVDGARQAAPAFVPRSEARGFLIAEAALLEGDLVLRPRVDAVAIGERFDFADRRLAGFLRVDATLVATVVGPVDLELAMRNLTDRREPLPVVEPASGALYLDSGRMTLVGIRWNLLD